MKTFNILFLFLATVFGAVAALPVQTTFTGSQSECVWTLGALDTHLPSDWTPYEFLVIEFKASSSQRFDLGLLTSSGQVAKRIGPFAGVWVRASIPLRFYRKPAGDGADLAATFNQPRSSYWINIHTGGFGPTTNVNAITVSMENPVGSPTLEIRSVALSTNDPGDAVLEGKPLIDEFGQYTHAEWPGKAKSLEGLKKAWTAEADELKNAPTNRCPYGGFLGTSAKATGYFRVEKVDGRWWFVCPDGHLFYSSGVNGVGTSSGTRVQGREDLFAAFPPANVVPPGRGGRPSGSFYTWNLQRRFGDDWLPKWAAFTTDRMAAWGFNTMHNWNVPGSDEVKPRVPYCAMLRGWQAGPSIMGMPDVYAEDFARRVDEAAARRKAFVIAAFTHYLDTINAAVRRHDTNHLNLGIRFGGDPAEEIVATARGFDVFSENIYSYGPSREKLDRLYALVQKPILMGEFHIGSPERGMASGLVQAKNQEERGVAYRYYVEQCASHPAVIGTHWFQWLDQASGRNDGENYNIGFVDVTDQPYAELVAAAKLTHDRLLEVHRGSIPPFDRKAKAQ